MADKTKLKEFLVQINKLSESLGSIKESIEGEKSMTEEEKLEAKAALEEAEAKKKAEAESKKLEEAKKEKEKSDIPAGDNSSKAEKVNDSDSKEAKELADKEKAKEDKKKKDDAEAANKGSMSKDDAKPADKPRYDNKKDPDDDGDDDETKIRKAKEKAAAELTELTKKLEDAEAKITLLTQEASKATAAVLAGKEQEIKDAVTKAIANFIESSKLADTRYSELEKLGVAFNGEKASVQKEKVSKMTEEAFASYKEDLTSIASSISLDSDALIKAAKEAAGAKSVHVDLKPVNKYDNFSKFL